MAEHARPMQLQASWEGKVDSGSQPRSYLQQMGAGKGKVGFLQWFHWAISHSTFYSLMPWSSCKTQKELNSVFVDILFHFGLGIFVILVFCMFVLTVLTFILWGVFFRGGMLLSFFFFTYSGFCFSFLFLFWRDIKLGGGGRWAKSGRS